MRRPALGHAAQNNYRDFRACRPKRGREFMGLCPRIEGENSGLAASGCGRQAK